VATTREPLIEIEGGRAWLKCSTPGCGRKRLGEIAPGTRLAGGWVDLQCPRCKAHYRLTARPLPMETLQQAS
jgi:hypothetical protein